MSLLEIKINGKEYKVECNQGEEDLLKQAVNLINEKINKSDDLKKTSGIKYVYDYCFNSC